MVFFLNDAATAESFLYWAPLFMLYTLSEYGVFLSESAIDAQEEAQFQLQALAAH